MVAPSMIEAAQTPLFLTVDANQEQDDQVAAAAAAAIISATNGCASTAAGADHQRL